MVAILCLFTWSCGSEEPLSPRSAEETVASFQLHPAVQADVFASEPLIRDPVEMVFDEDGRIFVAEMVDYPDYHPPEGQPPRSRVSLLEDRDGDGVIDHSTVFADRLLHATSLLPWKGGLIVTSAPDILYLKDTDGDGKADQREVLFTGFNDQVDPEGRITNLRLNVDNWIYASNHGHEGTVRFLRNPDAPAVSVQGSDFRFRLDKGLFEPAAGPTQFGQGVDDWGNRFITQNTIHVRHVVMPWRYLTRNLYLDSGNVSQDISDHGRPAAPMFQLTAPQQWRVERTRMRQQRYDEQGIDHVELLSGYFTAASGGTIYDGVSLGEEFRGNLFTGDVSGNLVHRDLLTPQGVSFVASRAPEEDKREFLASTDPWFRPCNFTVGPDGSLFIIDIYREFIETPASIPEELKKDMDFHSGTDLGRIYRISRKDSGSYNEPVRLSAFDSSQLVELLSHVSGWHRRTAHRLLLERADPAVAVELRNVVHHGESPQARVHAAYLLESLDQVDEEIVRRLVNDLHPEVRRHGVFLAEAFEGLFEEVLDRISDSSQRVQFQAILSLGEFDREGVLDGFAEALVQYPEDAWFRKAVLSSPRGSSAEMLDRLSSKGFFGSPSSGKEEMLAALSQVVGARSLSPELSRWFTLMEEPEMTAAHWQEAGLRGLKQGLEMAATRRLRSSAAEKFILKRIGSGSEQVQALARELAVHFELASLIEDAVREAIDASLSASRRVTATQILAGAPSGRAQNVLEQLLSAEEDPRIRQAAIKTLATFGSREAGRILVSQWNQLGPELRLDALDALLRHHQLTLELLDALDKRTIEWVDLDEVRREKLLEHPDSQISERATRIARNQPLTSTDISPDTRNALDLEGDAERGRDLFDEHCAVCHLPSGGRRIGPNLAGVSSNTRAQLLQSIANPSAVVEPRYRNYIVTTHDGRLYAGIIVSESPGTVTIRNAAGDDEVLLLKDIETMRPSRLSLMPQDLAEILSPQDLADLIAFLQGADLTE